MKRLLKLFKPKNKKRPDIEVFENNAYNEATDLDNDLPVIVMAKGIYKALLDKGLEGFLLSSFCVKTELTSEDFRNRDVREEKINQVACEISQYLKLPAIGPIYISFDKERNTSSPYGKTSSTVGEYRNNSNSRHISLNIGSGFTPENVLAILCHEYTHYFMEFHSLNWTDTELNEQRTDVMANMIGFNRIMIAGYAGVSVIVDERQQDFVNYQKVNSRRIGYISEDDCKVIGKHLMVFATQIKDLHETRNRLVENRTALNRQIVAAKALLLQLSAIDVKNQRITDTSKISEIQKCLYEYESRSIEAEISHYTEICESNDLVRIEQAIHDIDTLCVEMLHWCSVFQG